MDLLERALKKLEVKKEPLLDEKEDLPTKSTEENLDKLKTPLKSKKTYASDNINLYTPHGTDIMTSYKLISGKSIRKYKGKGTNKALLEGLIEVSNELLKTLKGSEK